MIIDGKASPIKMILMGKDNIVLVGLMGCGKTSVADELARLSGWEFIDTDAMIEKEQGMSISQIFSQKGEPEFRRFERETVEFVAHWKNKIIATGGGIFQDEQNRKLLLDNGWVFYLRAPVEYLFERTRGDVTRPLLQNAEPLETLRDLLAKREPFYLQAHHVIDVAQQAPLEIAREIWKCVEKAKA